MAKETKANVELLRSKGAEVRAAAQRVRAIGWYPHSDVANRRLYDEALDEFERLHREFINLGGKLVIRNRGGE